MRGLMRDEQFEMMTRNFGEKRLTGVVSLNVAKCFYTTWNYCLI